MSDPKLELYRRQIALAELTSNFQRRDIEAAKERIHLSGLAVRWDALTTHDEPGERPSYLTDGSIVAETGCHDDIPLTLNHGKTICSTGDGSLRLYVSSYGLMWTANLPACETSRWLAKEIKAGRLAGSSLSYRGYQRTANRDGKPVSEVYAVTQIRDVSIVAKARDPLCTTTVDDFVRKESSSQYAMSPAVAARVAAKKARRAAGGNGLLQRMKESEAALLGIMNNKYARAAARQAGVTTRALQMAALSGPFGHSELSSAVMWEADPSEPNGWRYLG